MICRCMETRLVLFSVSQELLSDSLGSDGLVCVWTSKAKAGTGIGWDRTHVARDEHVYCERRRRKRQVLSEPLVAPVAYYRRRPSDSTFLSRVGSCLCVVLLIAEVMVSSFERLHRSFVIWCPPENGLPEDVAQCNVPLKHTKNTLLTSPAICLVLSCLCHCLPPAPRGQAVQEYLVSELSSRDKTRQLLFTTESRPPSNAPRQHNSSDCGVLMLHVMEVRI